MLNKMYYLVANPEDRFSRDVAHFRMVYQFIAVHQSYTITLLKYWYHNSLKILFSKCYRRHYDLVSKYNVGLKSLLKQGLSDPEFYDDLVIFLIIFGK